MKHVIGKIWKTYTDGECVFVVNSGCESIEADAMLIAAAPELLEACKLLQAALTEHRLRDVKKRFSLCVADAAAGKAIHKAEGGA